MTTDDEVTATVDTAWAGGIRYFDTAPHYGVGLSERRLGAQLAAHPRDEYVVSTKVGRVLEPAEMTAVAEVVDRHGGRVFSDEIHAPLVFPGSRHVPYASLDDVTAGHAVTATSASKAWNLPGLKCAQLVLSNDVDVKVWDEVGERVEEGASTLGVLANRAAYAEGRDWLDDTL